MYVRRCLTWSYNNDDHNDDADDDDNDDDVYYMYTNCFKHEHDDTDVKLMYNN